MNVKHVNKFFRIWPFVDRYEWYYDRSLFPLQTIIRTGAFLWGDFNQRDISMRDIYNLIFLFEKKHKSLQTASNTKSMPKQISEK